MWLQISYKGLKEYSEEINRNLMNIDQNGQDMSHVPSKQKSIYTRAIQLSTQFMVMTFCLILFKVYLMTFPN
jgi:hypothetical protein